MPAIPHDVLRIEEAAIARTLPDLPQPFAVLFERGELSVELFAPRIVDTQQPHERDELYIVSSGTGVFRRGDQTVEFRAGDLLFVPATVPHRFEHFSDDFRTWVVFFGPPGGVTVK
jgi:mannose-6-phosphate isomerase-like protein (cupin superfamily)